MLAPAFWRSISKLSEQNLLQTVRLYSSPFLAKGGQNG